MLNTKRMSIVPTMRCTLRCKLCSNHVTEFKKPIDATVEEMIRDIDILFELFDKIEWLQFVGGEIFLHKGMAEVYDHCKVHRGKFSKLILESNATILPREAEITSLRKYGQDAKVMISDYGTLSSKSDEFIRILESNEIPYVVKKYHDDDQHYGGWIDNTACRDYGESDSMVAAKAAHCPQVLLENMHCFRGKLHRCSNSLFMSELKLFVPNDRDYVDLLDKSQSDNMKRDIIKDFYIYPRKSCHFCSWKDADSLQRYPAAEQI